MRDSDIHIGDVLKVRLWEDMAREYGNDEYGNVTMPDVYNFMQSMGHLCGRIFTVKSKQNTGRGCMRYYSVENVEEWENGYAWVITAGMLEPLEYEVDEFEVATDEEIKLLFG